MTEEVLKPQKNFLRSKLIDALLEIRLSLSVRKIVSPTIMKSEFKKILDGTKEKFAEVSIALDGVFEQYFPKRQEGKIMFNSFPPNSNDNINEYEEGGNKKGVSLVKRDNNHFNSSNDQ